MKWPERILVKGTRSLHPTYYVEFDDPRSGTRVIKKWVTKSEAEKYFERLPASMNPTCYKHVPEGAS